MATPKAITTRFDAALAYARQLHAGQVRTGTAVPYLAHLLGVAALVLEEGGDEDEAIAALLHDAVEDHGGRPSLEEIRCRFGERVATIVEGCSDSDTDPKPPWRVRKRLYLEHLREAPPEVLRVSCADKLHNGRAILADHREIGEALWARFTGGRAAVLWYYRALADAFQERGPARLAAELARVVSEIERRCEARPTP